MSKGTLNRQLKIKWEDTDHPFDWIDIDKVRPSDAKIGDAVLVVYFDGGLYPGKVVDQRMIITYQATKLNDK
jgi:hypothetical protein